MTAVPITTRDRDALTIFAYRLVDQRDVAGLVEHTLALARAGDEHAAGRAPAYALRPWLLGLMVLQHTRHEPRPSRDLALVSAFTDLPEESRAALWHLGVEGESAADAAGELGLEPSVVLAHARSGVSELRANVLAQFPPEDRPADCRWLHRRETEAPSVPLTKGELYRGEQHACSCAWCGEMEDQLALASGDLRKVMAVAALGSLAPLYLATRPQPSVTLAPPVPPAFTGVRRTVVANRRPIIGVGAVATVAAAALGIALINPVPDTQVYTADGAIVEIRGDASTGQGEVDGLIDLTGDGVVGGAAGDGGPGTTGGTGGTGGGVGGGGGTGGGTGGGNDGGDNDNGPGSPGSPDDGPSDDGSGEPLQFDLRPDPLRTQLGIGTEPLLGDDVEASVGTDGIFFSGLVDLGVPLLGSTTTTDRTTSQRNVTQQSRTTSKRTTSKRAGATQRADRRDAPAPRGQANGWRDGSPGRSASTPAATRSQRPSTAPPAAQAPPRSAAPRQTRPEAAAPRPKVSRPATSRPSTRGKAPAHSNAGGKGKTTKKSKPAPKKVTGQQKATKKRPGTVNKLLKGLLGGG